MGKKKRSLLVQLLYIGADEGHQPSISLDNALSLGNLLIGGRIGRYSQVSM